MVTIKDVFIVVLLGISFFLIGNWIIENTEMPWLIVPLVLVFFFIQIGLKRLKRIKEYVKADFEKLGFTILKERPLKMSETRVTVKTPAILTSKGTPLSRYRYVRQFSRVFMVESKKGKRFELNTVVTRKWDSSNHIEIVSKTAIPS